MAPLLGVLLAIASLSSTPDGIAVIRDNEHALAAAISTHDKKVLSSLTDSNFRLSWSYGSAIRNVRVGMSRQEWMDSIDHLAVEAYKVEIKRTSWVEKQRPNGPPASARVELTEFWILRSPRGGRIAKRVETFDFWIKNQGTWRLESRLCQSDVR